MPGTKKKPMANGRKKVTASARARISTRKVRKVVNAGLGESYTQQTVSREASNNATTLRCYNSPFLNCNFVIYSLTRPSIITVTAADGVEPGFTTESREH